MLIDHQVSNTRYFSLQAVNEPDLPWFEFDPSISLIPDTELIRSQSKTTYV